MLICDLVLHSPISLESLDLGQMNLNDDEKWDAFWNASWGENYSFSLHHHDLSLHAEKNPFFLFISVLFMHIPLYKFCNFVPFPFIILWQTIAHRSNLAHTVFVWSMGKEFFIFLNGLKKKILWCKNYIKFKFQCPYI